MSRSVPLVGWSTLLCSVVLMLLGISDLTTDPMAQFNVLFNMFPQTKVGTDVLAEMFRYNRIWSLYSILYFACVFGGSIQFIRWRAIGRTILEIACWVGLVNGCIDSFISYLLWQRLHAALSSVMGLMGMGLGNLYPLGIGTVIFGFLLWMIPAIGFLVYLRQPALKTLMK